MVKVIRPSTLIIRDNKLLVLRSRYWDREFYLLPGGAIENDETLIETAIRETKEETNYDVEITKLLYLQEWIDKERNKNVLDVIFLGKIVGGEETHLNDVSNHIQAIEWKTVAELKTTTFFPTGILSKIEQGIENDFKDNAVYLDPDVSSMNSSHKWWYGLIRS